MSDETEETDCPERDDGHCTCWWDGDPCCCCDAVAMTDEQKLAQGMELT